MTFTISPEKPNTMTNDDTRAIRNQTVAQHCSEIAEIGGQAKALASQSTSEEEFVEWLVDQSLHRDALLYLSHVMPEREAALWSSRCCKVMGHHQSGPANLEAYKSIELWLKEPRENDRLGMLSIAEGVGLETPVGLLAIAIWSESNGAPEEMPGHPPKGKRIAPLIAKSILLAAVTDEQRAIINDQEVVQERLSECVAIGIRVAEDPEQPPAARRLEKADSSVEPQLTSSPPNTDEIEETDDRAKPPTVQRPSVFQDDDFSDDPFDDEIVAVPPLWNLDEEPKRVRSESSPSGAQVEPAGTPDATPIIEPPSPPPIPEQPTRLDPVFPKRVPRTGGTPRPRRSDKSWADWD